jgi:hypothetical protein
MILRRRFLVHYMMEPESPSVLRSPSKLFAVGRSGRPTVRLEPAGIAKIIGATIAESLFLGSQLDAARRRLEV